MSSRRKQWWNGFHSLIFTSGPLSPLSIRGMTYSQNWWDWFLLDISLHYIFSIVLSCTLICRVLYFYAMNLNNKRCYLSGHTMLHPARSCTCTFYKPSLPYPSNWVIPFWIRWKIVNWRSFFFLFDLHGVHSPLVTVPNCVPGSSTM